MNSKILSIVLLALALGMSLTASAQAMQSGTTADGNTVVATPSTPAVSGPANWGNSNKKTSVDFFTAGEAYRILQTGRVEGAQVYVVNKTCLSGFYINIFRQSGDKFVLIKQSNNLVGELVAGTVSNLRPSPYLYVKSGDYIGYRIESGSDCATPNFANTVASGATSMYLFNATSTPPTSTWYGSDVSGYVSNYILPIQLFVKVGVNEPVPLTVANVAANSVTTNGFDVTWNTNKPSDSKVGYGLSTGSYRYVSSPSMVTNHSVRVSDLTPGTMYYFSATSVDADGLTVTSPYATIRTAQNTTTTSVDSSMIYSITSANPTANSIVIRWATDQYADSQVEYGYTTSYGNTTIRDQEFVLSHSQTINTLLPNMTYHYRVIARNSSGVMFRSADQVFTTASQNSYVNQGNQNSTTCGLTFCSAPLDTGAGPNASSNTSSNVTGTAFTKDLKMGMKDVQVQALQKYLNNKGYVIAKTGPGSPGNETFYFGAGTRAALAHMQAVSGISPAAGFFGKVTRTYVNSR